MEHTATVNDLTAPGDPASVAQIDRKVRTYVGVGATTLVLAIQVALWITCTIARGATAVKGVVLYAGLAAAAAGIYLGLRQCRLGSRFRGLNCAIPSMAAFSFWMIQLLARDIPFAG